MRGLRWLIVLALSFCCGLAGAQPKDGPRYRDLHRVLAPSLIVAEYPRLMAVQRIVSRLPGVKPDSIEIRIDSATQARTLRIAADGSVEVPLTQALYDENPPIRSNQPQGSLSVSINIELRPPTRAELRYAEFQDAFQQARAAIRKLGDDYAEAEIEGAEFRFADTSGRIEIRDGKREELLIADGEGRVFLRNAADLGSNAELRISGQINSVLPRVVVPR